MRPGDSINIIGGRLHGRPAFITSTPESLGLTGKWVLVRLRDTGEEEMTFTDLDGVVQFYDHPMERRCDF
jgi:hypothetical protein